MIKLKPGETIFVDFTGATVLGEAFPNGLESLNRRQLEEHMAIKKKMMLTRVT